MATPSASNSLVGHIPDLRRYARSLTGDTWAADDLVQDTLERACERWQLWAAGSDLRAWLFTLMHNLFVDNARRAVRQQAAQRVDVDEVAHELQSPAGVPDQAMDLQRCLLRLPAGTTGGAAPGHPPGPGLRGGGTHHRGADRHGDVEAAGTRAPAGPDGWACRRRGGGLTSLRRLEMMERTMKDDNPTAAGRRSRTPRLRGRPAGCRSQACGWNTAWHDPEAPSACAPWKQQRHALRTLHPEMLLEPVPSHLMQAAMQLHRRSSRFAQWQRWGGMAAAVLLAFGLGWGGGMQWQTAGGDTAVLTFARQAVTAHAVYMPEVRHPVEVEASQQQHLVQWLSKRLNRQLKIPNPPLRLRAVGGRLLPGDAGARAQFMYQNAAGERVTL